MKTNLVTVQEAKAVTSSLQVAQTFGKDHRHVLESIRNLAAENSATKLYFTESQYENRGKWYPMYIINRDGFTLLAMGFTGKKALQFKIDYINAFNQMEEYIKNQSVQNPLPSPHGKYRRKRVETYLPADDVLRLQTLAYTEGYNSIYHLLQVLIYNFMNSEDVNKWKKIALECMKQDNDARNKIFWRDLKIQELEDDLVLYKDKYQKCLQFINR